MLMSAFSGKENMLFEGIEHRIEDIFSTDR
jgi:hypothetical protein